jgi:hypothetical protein
MDPITHTASWLAPPAPGTHPLSPDDADPVIAMIAEEARLEALATEAQARGDAIFLTLPEDIRKEANAGLVQW